MHLRCSRTGKGKYMYLFDVKQHNYSFTLIIDNNDSVLVSLQFWGKNNCTNIELLVSAQNHSSAVVD